MQIKGPQTPAASSGATSSTSSTTMSAAQASVSAATMVRGWRSGQTLQATVMQNPHAGPPLLEINGRLLQARASQSLSPGQRLQLEVIRAGTEASLKLLSPAPHNRGSHPNITLPPPVLSGTRWQAGQIIQALIVQHPPATPGKTAGKPSLVQIAGSILPLSLPPLAAREAQPGQSLQLQIINPGQPATLRVVNVSTPGISPEQAIRDALPRQLPLSVVLANLAAIAASAGQRGANLPGDVLRQVRQILDQLPQRGTVGRGDGLQQALANSGIFLEARLAEALRTGQPFAHTAQQLGGDLKGGLLGLLSLLLGLRIPPDAAAQTTHSARGNVQNRPADVPPPLPNSQPFAQPRVPANAASLNNPALHGMPHISQQLRELLRQAEGGLARIQLSQLASGTVEDDGRRNWLLDLPLRHGDQIDVLQMRIEEERSGKGKGETSLWSIALAFELEGLGVIHARVTLAGGTVNATFWAVENHAAELFGRHMNELQQSLQQAGLSVGSLAAHHGTPQAADEKPALPYVLLDVEA